MDEIFSLVGKFTFGARLFFKGAFCDANDFPDGDGAAYLHLVRAGPVVFSAPDGSSFCVDEPAMVFYPCGAAHGLAAPDGGEARLLCANIRFADGARNLLARSLPSCLCLPLRALGTASQTLSLLFDEASAHPQGAGLILGRLCEVLMIQLVRYQFDSGALPQGLLAGLADRQLAPVLAAIHERPGLHWQLSTMAELACMSRAGFAAHFHSVVGIPPGEYLARWRITTAQRLLLCGHSAKCVSARVGYANPASFSRAFTAIVGAPPRHWLRGTGKDAVRSN